MTMYEIGIIIKSQAEKLEYELRIKTQMNYDLALNTAMAVMSMFGGKQPPSIQDRYPTLFMDQEDQPEDAPKQPEAWELYKEQMIDFANLHNKNRKKKKEG